MDALMWLKDHYEEQPGDIYTKEDYEKLKLWTQICVKEDGILVKYRNGIMSEVYTSQPSTELQLVAWKERVIKFLDSDEKVLHLRGLQIDDLREAKSWIEERLSNLLESEFEVNSVEVKIVK
jgi:hypothetical protein